MELERFRQLRHEPVGGDWKDARVYEWGFFDCHALAMTVVDDLVWQLDYERGKQAALELVLGAACERSTGVAFGRRWFHAVWAGR